MAKTKKSEKTEIVSNIPTAETLRPAAVPESQLPAPRGPSPSMLALFAPGGDAAPKIRKLTLPPIIKPKLVGPGVSFMGKITSVIDSPVSTYKSRILLMEHPKAGAFAWPANAVTCGALAEMVGVDRKEFDLFNPKHAQKVIGRTIIVEGLGASTTQTGKNVNLYNIAEVLE